jgi:hypothetical protein
MNLMKIRIGRDIMLTLLGYLVVFCVGWACGAYARGAAYELQPWEIFRWNRDIMGYRIVPLGSRLFEKEKVIMGLEMDTSGFPEEGLVYTSDEDFDEKP